jgi:hypothetical protein
MPGLRIPGGWAGFPPRGFEVAPHSHAARRRIPDTEGGIPVRQVGTHRCMAASVTSVVSAKHQEGDVFIGCVDEGVEVATFEHGQMTGS